MTADLSAEMLTSKEYFTELEPLRRREEKLEENVQDLVTNNKEAVEKRKNADFNSLKYEKSLIESQNQLKAMNEDRHKTKVLLVACKEERDAYAQQRDLARMEITDLNADVHKAIE